MKNTILVVEFGGQLTQLIIRRLRESFVRAILSEPNEIPFDAPPDIAGVILSGGPKSVDEEDAQYVRRILTWQVPVLGICYGHQLLAYTAGAHVKPQEQREYGREILHPTGKASRLIGRAHRYYQVWMSHGDSVTNLPNGWETTAVTENCDCAAMENTQKRHFGVQFHPESIHTAGGRQLLEHFAADICGAPQTYTKASLVEELKSQIRQQVGEQGHLMVACSLGVDSTTVAKLCQDALGPERVHPVMINNGLLRQEDMDLIPLGKTLLPNLNVIDAQQEFLVPLCGESDPEKKRHSIGVTFWNVLGQEARRLEQQYPIKAFTLGTISPDVIESGHSSSRTAKIKTHHNLVKVPPDFPFTRFEPLRDFWLFKDQVREIARASGVSDHICDRHPFPGPGLAVRVSGEFTLERLEIVRAADAIFIDELHRAGLYHEVSQAGAVALNDRSVCQQGDERHLGWTIMIWAFVTEDFMTADVPKLPDDFLASVASRISREVHGAGRVGFNYTTKPPGTIEWE